MAGDFFNKDSRAGILYVGTAIQMSLRNPKREDIKIARDLIGRDQFFRKRSFEREQKINRMQFERASGEVCGQENMNRVNKNDFDKFTHGGWRIEFHIMATNKME